MKLIIRIMLGVCFGNMYRIVSFLLLIVIVVVDCQNTFMAKKDNKFVCITNGNTALSWIVNKSELLEPNLELDNESHYIPESPNNTFDCKVSNDSKTRTYFLKKPWILENSSSTYIPDGIILDRRWEQMKRYLLVPKSYLNYHVFKKDEGPDIFLALSIRADYEAHILFCDAEFPPLANICYWLTLEDRRNGTKSTMSKCLKGSIGFKDYFYPIDNKCKKIRTIKHPLILRGNSWSHFDLLRKGSYLNVRSSTDEKESIFEATYPELLNYVIIHTTRVDMFWKLHEVDYIFTNETSKNIRLGPSIYIQNDFVCISMFVKMCDSCNIKLRLVSGNLCFGETTFKQKVNYFSPWHEIRFLVDNIRVDKVNLLVSTTRDRESDEMFWAIDDVRLCQKKEFRVISSSIEASCQSLSYASQLVTVDRSEALIFKDCPRDNNSCVPCEWIYDYCEPLYFYIPGFVLLFAILAAVIIYIYLRYRRKKESVQIAHAIIEMSEVNQNIANTHSSTQKKANIFNVFVNQNPKGSESASGYLQPASPSMPVSSKTFHKYVKDSNENGILDRQFKEINSMKIYYDEIEGNSLFHYIDMIYNSGTIISKAYLVTQVPGKDKSKDFWKFIYESNIKHVVLLNKENEDDSLCYWPNINEELSSGNMSVRMARTHHFSSYDYKTFILEKNGQQRRVNHITFSYDGSVVKKYVPFLKKLSEYRLSSQSPILFHTSDSIRRIGLVLLCDMSVRMAKEEKQIDVLKNFKRLIDQVAQMVDDLPMYKLSHSIISELVFEAEFATNLVQIHSLRKN